MASACQPSAGRQGENTDPAQGDGGSSNEVCPGRLAPDYSSSACLGRYSQAEKDHASPVWGLTTKSSLRARFVSRLPRRGETPHDVCCAHSVRHFTQPYVAVVSAAQVTRAVMHKCSLSLHDMFGSLVVPFGKNLYATMRL